MPDQGSNDPTKPASPQKSKQSTRSDDARAKHRANVNEKAQRLRDNDDLAFNPNTDWKKIPAVAWAQFRVEVEKTLLSPLGSIGAAIHDARRAPAGEKKAAIKQSLKSSIIGALGNSRSIIGQTFANKLSEGMKFSDDPFLIAERLQKTQELAATEFNFIEARFLEQKNDIKKLSDTFDKFKNDFLNKETAKEKKPESKQSEKVNKNEGLKDKRRDEHHKMMQTKFNESVHLTNRNFSLLDKRIARLENKAGIDQNNKKGKLKQSQEIHKLEDSGRIKTWGGRASNNKSVGNGLEDKKGGLVNKIANVTGVTAAIEEIVAGSAAVGAGAAYAKRAIGAGVGYASRAASAVGGALSRVGPLAARLAPGLAARAGMASLGPLGTAAALGLTAYELYQLLKGSEANASPLRPGTNPDRLPPSQQYQSHQNQSGDGRNSSNQFQDQSFFQNNDQQRRSGNDDWQTMYDRQRIHEEKRDFMMYGKSPRGFEFAQGHMGRLGMPAAVAATGAQPLGTGSGSFGGGWGGGSSGGTGGGGTSFGGGYQAGGGGRPDKGGYSGGGGTYIPGKEGVGPPSPKGSGVPIQSQYWQGGSIQTGLNEVPKLPSGGSPYLAKDREAYFKEMDNDPRLRDMVMSAMKAEDGGNLHLPLEAMMNRISARRQKGGKFENWGVKDELYSGFYGPVNKKHIKSHPLNKDGEAAIAKVRGGSREIGLLTDQGMKHEHSGRPTTQFGADHYSQMFPKWGKLTAKREQEYNAQFPPADGQDILPKLGMIKTEALRANLNPQPLAEPSISSPPGTIPNANQSRAPSGPSAQPQNGYTFPVTGDIGGAKTPQFGRERGRLHAGVDIYSRDPETKALRAGKNAAVYAVADGRVVSSRASNGYGWIVDVKDSKGLYHRYAHIAQPTGPDGKPLNVGDAVKQGQTISHITGSGTQFGAAVLRDFNGDADAAVKHYEKNGWPNQMAKPHLHYEVRTSPNSFGGSNVMDPAKIHGPAMGLEGKGTPMVGGGDHFNRQPDANRPVSERGFLKAPPSTNQGQQERRLVFDTDNPMSKAQMEAMIQKGGPNVDFGGNMDVPTFGPFMKDVNSLKQSNPGVKSSGYTMGIGAVNFSGFPAEVAEIQKLAKGYGMTMEQWKNGGWQHHTEQLLLQAQKNGTLPDKLEIDNLNDTNLAQTLPRLQKFLTDNKMDVQLHGKNFTEKEYAVIDKLKQKGLVSDKFLSGLNIVESKFVNLHDAEKASKARGDTVGNSPGDNRNDYRDKKGMAYKSRGVTTTESDNPTYSPTQSSEPTFDRLSGFTSMASKFTSSANSKPTENVKVDRVPVKIRPIYDTIDGPEPNFYFSANNINMNTPADYMSTFDFGPAIYPPGFPNAEAYRKQIQTVPASTPIASTNAPNSSQIDVTEGVGPSSGFKPEEMQPVDGLSKDVPSNSAFSPPNPSSVSQKAIPTDVPGTSATAEPTSPPADEDSGEPPPSTPATQDAGGARSPQATTSGKVPAAGGMNNPETESEAPGSGGYGSQGRCYV